MTETRYFLVRYRVPLLLMLPVELALITCTCLYFLQRQEIRQKDLRLNQVLTQRDDCRHLHEVHVDHLLEVPGDSSFLNNFEPKQVESAFMDK